jgi:hypothetical protein
MPAPDRPPAPPAHHTCVPEPGRSRRPEDDRVPIAVWPAMPTASDSAVPGPPRPAGVLPPLLAERLLTAYTRPQDVVLAAGAGASVAADTAERAGRRPVLDPAECATAFPPLGVHRAALLVLTAPAVSTEPARYTRWAASLAPGGILAVLIPAAPADGVDCALAGRITAAACHAGLGYLQHIIVVLARLTGDHLDPAPTPEQLARTRAGHAAGLPVHLPVHSDLLIYQRHPTPAGSAAASTPTRILPADARTEPKVTGHAHAA